MSKKIKLLIITKSTGGVAEYIRWLVEDLDQNKFHITVVCLSENSDEFASNLRKRVGVSAESYFMERYDINFLSDFRVYRKLRKLLNTGDFDIIHAHSSKVGFLTRLASMGTGIPVLYSPHCFAFHEGASRLGNLITVFLERLVIPLTTRIVTVSYGERDLALAKRVGYKNIFTVIQTGIDPVPYRQDINKGDLKKKLDIPISSPIVGAVGRLIKQKSPADFVTMADKIHKSNPDVHFVWVGDGPLEKMVKNKASSLGISEFIHWLGHRDDVKSILHIIDCLVLPSRWEGFPIVVLESMAAGVPVVATDIYGTRELIHDGVNGILTPVGNPIAIAEHVTGLLDNKKRGDEFVLSSQKRIDTEFTRNTMMEKIQNLYLEIAIK